MLIIALLQRDLAHFRGNTQMPSSATIACGVLAAICGLTALALLPGSADVIPESVKKGNSPELLVHLARTLGHEIAIMVTVIAASIANGRCATLAKFLGCGMLLSAGWHHAWGNANEAIASVVFAAGLAFVGFVSSGEDLPATKWGKHAIACTLQACLMGATALTLLSGSAAALPTALTTLSLGAKQALGKDLLLAAITVLAGALDNSAPTICKFLPFGILVSAWSHAMMDDMQGAALNSCFALGFAVLGFAVMGPDHGQTGAKKAQ